MFPQSVPGQIILFAPLLGWLAACTACDLRTRQVPSWLTVIPLAAAGIWRFVQGGWPVVLLVVGLVLLSDLPWRKMRLLLACAAAGLALVFTLSLDQAFVVLAVASIWVMWEVGAIGGADAKVIITLLLLFADGLLLIPIALAGGIQGLAALIAGRKTIPYTVAIAFGMVVWLWFRASS